MKRWAGNAWQRFVLSAHVGWLVVAGYLIGRAADHHLLGAGLGERLRDPAGRRVALAGSLLIGAVCGLRAARYAQGRRRYGWLAMVTAQLGWAVGEII
ncbi:hypothetical protein [Mycobacterium tilburgii]|uniref:hypothetical protein n=1 Tax=Mycobacterium tilburgii TaxID=44467 RepID=UPI0011845AEE|nr:hypothetical protein [Mycobacterium tilburgii]